MNNQFIQRVIFDWNRIDNDSYLKGIEAFKGIEKLDFNKPITFFVGENGSGKSTLLEALAVAHGFNPEGGTKNYVFSTHDTHSELCDAIRISKGYRKEKWGYFLRAESFYNVATQEEEYADFAHPSAKYHEKSHGESFLALAQNNLQPNGLYLFDEPEAALSPQRQLTLLIQIYRCAKEGAQFFIVTHSPILLGIPDADIYCFDNGSIHLCEYEEKRIAANPHTLAEVVQYAKDHYDLVEINPAATNWIERQKNLKASLIMQHKPELLGQRKDIPKPDFHNEESVKNFLNEMEIRNKLIDQMPDNVIPMDFHLYEIKIGEDLMEIEVDYTWNIFGISYSGNKSVIKRFKKIARDLYCYYGVSEEDIKNRTKRYSSLVTELSS